MEFSLHNYIVFEVENLLNATKLVIKIQKAAPISVEKLAYARLFIYFLDKMLTLAKHQASLALSRLIAFFLREQALRRTQFATF
jgi:hypothetical protein